MKKWFCNKTKNYLPLLLFWIILQFFESFIVKLKVKKMFFNFKFMVQKTDSLRTVIFRKRFLKPILTLSLKIV